MSDAKKDQIERAKRIRARIDELTNSTEQEPATNESPNDFVERKMREQAAQQGSNKPATE